MISNKDLILNKYPELLTQLTDIQLLKVRLLMEMAQLEQIGDDYKSIKHE